MSDDRFTRIAAQQLINARDLVDWGIAGGHTTSDQLRLAIVPRNQIPELKKKGLSNRKIAKLTGVGETTVRRDLAAPNGANNAPNDASEMMPELPPGRFETIVIDPPWPMTKIERDERQRQAGFSYSTMDEHELREFAASIKAMAADECHIFMWTTARFFPLALELVNAYGFKYVLPMVWHKPGGFQPTGLPQFNCEFIIYGRKGTPKFIDTKGFPCCFNAPRREHSRKPDEFYDIVSLVTKGPRIDVFSREKREGFAQYGDETEHFAGGG